MHVHPHIHVHICAILHVYVCMYKCTYNTCSTHRVGVAFMRHVTFLICIENICKKSLQVLSLNELY